MASCKKKKNNLKESLTHLAYYNCKHIPSVHGRFNNLLNIDLLKFESCSYSKELLELTQSFSLLPAVDKPTRVYGNSATLIDNIFSNNLENSLICGNIVTDTNIVSLPRRQIMILVLF